MILGKKGYSGLINFLSFLLDLLLINLLAQYFPLLLKYPFTFHLYISLVWIIVSVRNNFYTINRFEKVTNVLRLIFIQFLFFFLSLYAFIGFFKQPNISRLNLGLFFLSVFIGVLVLKLFGNYVLQRYLKFIKDDYTNVVIIGKNKKTDDLTLMFKQNNHLGYKVLKRFNTGQDGLQINKLFDFLKENQVDEIFSSIKELKNEQIASLINYADYNLIKLKFIPDNKEIFTRDLKLEYYEYFPVLSLRKLPLDDQINRFYKRSFDFLFSLFVFVFLLSWLMPIIGILIKLDSKGPIYFRQNRPGFYEEGFGCYKFRTMRINDTTEKSATKNDPRITKLGSFLRRSSIDELPQFINVLLGQMSVVGPRPHLWRQNQEYNSKIKKYMLRHNVKPGITGLAQSKGYRGEILKDEDIINRTRYDFFYIENWSLLLDIKIIFDTIVNVIKGQEKAY